MSRFILALALLVNCSPSKDAGDSPPADHDGDGFAEDVDCDDGSAYTNPDSTEACNGRDDNCDGSVDEGVTTMHYPDADADGYGDADAGVEGCPEAGLVDLDGDCDDSNAAISPDATELCNEVDDNCDGSADEGVTTPFYGDADGDGYGEGGDTVEACSVPTGYAATDDDCDDSSGDVHPGASEQDCADPTDYNCDGSTGFVDVDEDSYAACAECDDGASGVNPGATETCNGVDDDCDGDTDEADAADAQTWYADADGDGYGDPDTSSTSCDPGDGWVSDATDCDDTDELAFPGADEVCDGTDDDCDGVIDEIDATDVLVWYADADSDGFGDAGATTIGCDAPAGYVGNAADCDDADDTENPDALELCDGDDDDCDGTVDEGEALDAETYYADADGDGFGDPGATTPACSLPAGHVEDATDCDDTDAAENPLADETCDGDDDDCDGEVDEVSAVDVPTWYADADSDGYGDPALPTVACDSPPDHAANGADCDDTSAAVSPADREMCNGVDDNCDGVVDEDTALDATSWYADADSDGYGDSAVVAAACSAPSGYVADSDDCDDTSASVNPSATEVCNGINDDCDGRTDESGAADETTWYRDSDADGYGDSTATRDACDQPSGFVSTSGDCDDFTSATSPAASESCDGVDNDCDGSLDEGC